MTSMPVTPNQPPSLCSTVKDASMRITERGTKESPSTIRSPDLGEVLHETIPITNNIISIIEDKKNKTRKAENISLETECELFFEDLIELFLISAFIPIFVLISMSIPFVCVIYYTAFCFDDVLPWVLPSLIWALAAGRFVSSLFDHHYKSVRNKS